jgi:hypothetical protein
MVAPGPGSNGKKRGIPWDAKCALRSSHFTPGWTVAEPSAAETERMESMREVSREMPPKGCASEASGACGESEAGVSGAL